MTWGVVPAEQIRLSLVGEVEPDDPDLEGQVLDDMAIERRRWGDFSVVLTMAEKQELVRRMHAQGLNDYEIGARVGWTHKTVARRRKDLGLAAVHYPQVSA